MSKIAYPAIIERADHGYSVFFPDLAGLTSAGRTVTEASVAAEQALAAHLMLSAEHGDRIPPPSTMETVMRDSEGTEVARILVWANLAV